jgi:hypothetical protein
MTTYTPDPMVAGIITALDDLVGLIETAGVRCTRNPEEASPPCAIVAAPTFVGGTLGGIVATVPVYFVAPDPGQRGVDAMLEMLAQALPALGTQDASPTLWTTPLNPDGLPAYAVSVTLTIERG